MRHLPVPVIPRTSNDTILLDVRTIEKHLFSTIVNQLKELDVLEEVSLIGERQTGAKEAGLTEERQTKAKEAGLTGKHQTGADEV